MLISCVRFVQLNIQMMNLDEIFLLSDLSLPQSIEQLEQEINQWKEKQFRNIEMIYNEFKKKLHLFYQKSVDDFEQAKNKVMDDCLEFTIDELDMYLKRILENV